MTQDGADHHQLGGKSEGRRVSLFETNNEIVVSARALTAILESLFDDNTPSKSESDHDDSSILSSIGNESDMHCAIQTTSSTHSNNDGDECEANKAGFKALPFPLTGDDDGAVVKVIKDCEVAVSMNTKTRMPGSFPASDDGNEASEHTINIPVFYTAKDRPSSTAPPLTEEELALCIVPDRPTMVHDEKMDGSSQQQSTTGFAIAQGPTLTRSIIAIIAVLVFMGLNMIIPLAECS